jgi:phosphoribosyl-ATP pyrophosphohydrolase
MERREDLLGIAEKLPKSAAKISKLTASALARRRIVAPEAASLRKRR